MASSIELFCAICIILVRLSLSNGAQGKSLKSFHNATDHESPWTSGRSKRSLANIMPVELYIIIEYEVGNIENLIFVKTNQKLANRHLPVDAPVNYLFRDTVMSDIGEFVMYQDLATSSAIVYFGKQKAIFGVIRTDFHIQEFSLEWDQNGHVLGILKSPYLVKREGACFQLDHPNIISLNHIDNKETHEMYQNYEHLKNPQAGPSTHPEGIQKNTGGMNDKQNDANKHGAYNDKGKRKYKTEYYLESLVFISQGVAEISYNSFKEDYINQIVRYYLIYFNTVDVFFQKLYNHGITIYINIAKIVIDDGILTPFDFISQREVEFTDLMDQLPAYFKKYSSKYPPDSFDHVFIVTERPIIFETTTSARGLTKSGQDLILGRAKNKFYEAVSFTIIRAESYYSGYCNAVGEIGQVFDPNMDPLEYKAHLEWSENSLNKFKAFFSKNPNRVFLRNKPRSLLSPGPHALITTDAHCKCFGYDRFLKVLGGTTSKLVGENNCGKRLHCIKDGEEQTNEIPMGPLDGTRCTKFKVCWGGKCVIATSLNGD